MMRPRLLALLALLLCVAAILLLAPWAETPSDPARDAPVRSQAERDGGPTLVAPPARDLPPAPLREPTPAVAPDASNASAVVTVTLPPGPPLTAPLDVIVRDARGATQRAPAVAGEPLTFTRLAPGLATFDVRSPDALAPHPQEAQLVAGSETRVELPLRRGGTVEGRVLGARDRAPIADARVDVRGGGALGGESSTGGRLSHGEVRTDAEGRFRTHALPFGTLLTLHASARGFRRVHQPLRLDGSGARHAPVELLLEAGGRVVGVARDPDGAPMPGAVVTVGLERDAAWHDNPFVNRYPDPDVEPLVHVRTDAEGAYAIEGLTLGEAYCVVATGAPHALSAPVCDLRPTVEAPEVRAEPRLRRHGRLHVRAIDPEGRPISDGRVRVEPEWNESQPLNGSEPVDLGWLVPGTHVVTVRVPGLLALPQRVAIGEGETKDLVVRLEAGATIAGRVVDDRGEPIEGASVTAHAEDDGEAPGGHAASAADGAFVLRGLARAAYVLEARSGERRSTGLPAVAASAEGVRLVVPRSVRVRVRLVVPEGAAAPERRHVGYFSAQGNGSAGDEAWGAGVVERVFPAGGLQLHARVEGFAPWVRELRLEPGQDVDLGDVLLERGDTLAGRVLDAAGKPVANASVEITTPGGSSTQADLQGRFRVAHVGSGGQRLAAIAHGFVAASIVVDVTGDRSDLVLTLHRGARLYVALARFDPARDEDLRLHAEALEDPAGPGRWDWFEPDGRGAARALLNPGRYRVELLRGKQVIAEATADLVDEKETRVEIAVPR